MLNCLTSAGVLAENKLFATLDTTSRGLTLEDNRKIILIDTVGFIRKLPHHLVEAFKSTLEETVTADFLIQVIDASKPQYSAHIEVVDRVLADLGAVSKPTIGVYNKSDACTETPVFNRQYEENVFISAKNGSGIDELMKAIEETAPGKKKEIKIIVPYTEGALVNELHEKQKILQEEYKENGTEIRLLADSEVYEKLKSYII